MRVCAKMALFWLFCLSTTHWHAVVSIDHTYGMPTKLSDAHIQTVAGYAPARSIAN